MLHMSHPAPINGVLGGAGNVDGSGTINPAALNHPGSNVASFSQSRGVKRSRSPEIQREPIHGDGDDSKPRKRGRPPKAVKIMGGPIAPPIHSAVPSMTQTPQTAQHAHTQASPSHASPSKTTPTKTPVLKALPTVRDHTSNELNEQGDEYLPRETDEAGEKKVAPNGAPLGGRQYKCRTFYMPNRGDRLFMLATECAKVLNYRDSYLLFNKNRSLFKIIANQLEKNELILQDILPSSYRSRQIAIVTARSMYRQFGSRLIVNGRRVRDDYWESKARKQGFTEEDMAGEKRPGAAKAREAAQAAQEATNAAALAALPQGPIIYSTVSSGGAPMGHPHGLPMIQSIPDHDLGDYSSVQRPRHDITGTAYHDKTQPSPVSDIMTHATQAADFNQSLARQRANRGSYLESIWRQPHAPSPGQHEGSEVEASSSVSQAQRSPQQPAAMSAVQGLESHTPQPRHSMMTPTYAPPQQHQQQQQQQQQLSHGMIAQSPGRGTSQQLPSTSINHRSPTLPMGLPGTYGQAQQYGYPQPQMWSSAPAQPSPQVQAPMQYGQSMQQASPHIQSSVIHQNQLHQGPPSAGMPGMSYNTVPGSMNHPPNYTGVPRQMYQPGQPSQQYIQHGQTVSTQPGMQSWQQQGPSQGHTQQQHWNQNF